MFDKLRTLFTNKDDRQLREAKDSFDKLMEKVDEDQLDIDRVKRHVEAEFDGIGREIDGIRRGVDETINNKAA